MPAAMKMAPTKPMSAWRRTGAAVVMVNPLVEELPF
jgi:hypothetical protein